MSKIKHSVALVLLASSAANAGAAPGPDQPPAPARAPALQRLMDCRTLTEPAARLDCFDKQVAALDAAVSGREVIVADRETVREARRGLFGLTLPTIRLFGGGSRGVDADNNDEDIKEIESTVRSVGRVQNSRWLFTLADGARWQQIDTRNLPSDPHPGSKIRIRSALLGSYLANLDGQIAIRVRRIN